jgi:hypothetical protein
MHTACRKGKSLHFTIGQHALTVLFLAMLTLSTTQVAEMVNHCTIAHWRTNSEVQLARSTGGPLGPFEKLADLILPWAHNPQTIVSPDAAMKHGYVYAVYALGDGVQRTGPPCTCNMTATPPFQCNKTAQPEPQHQLQPQPNTLIGTPLVARSAAAVKGPHNSMTANFTIHWAEEAVGPYHAVNASILNWPTNWDYGAKGNWNPSPYQHPNGTVRGSLP